jgi:hypothetical protein
VDDLYSLIVGASASRPVGRRYNLLYIGASRLARSFELDEVLASLEDDMQYAVANSARRKVFVHAGVIAWRGRALIMLGASDADSTRLVTALTSAGASYYADRFAVLDAHGRVHAFPRVGVEPLPVGAIVSFSHRAATRWRPRALTQGQAVLALLEHAVSAAERPAFALRVADAAVASAHAVLRGAFSDEGDLVTTLLDATEGRTHALATWRTSHAKPHSQRQPVLSQNR